ncbi:DEAD/DEAH box helicase family protein [Aerococcus vaginalis]
MSNVSKKNMKKRKALPLLEELVRLDEDIFVDQEEYQLPKYISDNLKHTLRYYQDNAIRYYRYIQELDQFKFRHLNHFLFNMATGSGKTDLMAALILYLYEHAQYQNFLFVVNATSVLNKTIANLINSRSDKFLFKNTIEIKGKRLNIVRVNRFPTRPQPNFVYIKFATIQSISNDLARPKENTMGLREYSKNKVVVLADEAHHYSAATKKAEKDDENSWEYAISSILDSNDDNQLLEFTATVNLDDDKIYSKYEGKIIYQYTLDQFIMDGYSKNVRRIQSSNTDKDNMLNAVLLSEFRRQYALHMYGAHIKPVILFKSPKIDVSNSAEQTFNNMIENLTVEKLSKFINLQQRNESEEFSDAMTRTFDFYLKNKDNLYEIIDTIKREFSPNRIINANDSDRSKMLEKGQYEALNSLESPDNLFRVVFAVAKLTEGWDVLNLYDIVRLSDSEAAKGTKSVTNSEAQLIGRGARYNPFVVDGKSSFKRRFEDGSRDSVLLETLHYHTINEPQYLKNLVKSLDEMNLPTEEDVRNPLLDFKVKPSFKKTELWKKGNIYYNEKVEVNPNYYDNLNKYAINNSEDIVVKWKTSAKEVNYNANIVREDYSSTHKVPIKIDKRYLNKIMNKISFYYFDNLTKFIPTLSSRQEFLGKDWLNIDNRTIYAIMPMDIDSRDLTPDDKLEILEIYFTELSQKIQSGFKRLVGTNKFIGYPIREYISNYRKREPQYDTGQINMNDLHQHAHRREKREDYFVYDAAMMNDLEDQLVDRIGERVDELKETYESVYLIRMDENMHRESVKNEALKLHQFGEQEQINLEAFQPDFILLLVNEEHYLQIFIEPKGTQLLEKDQWKENLLTYLEDNQGEIVFENEINGLKVTGLKFFISNDARETIKQLGNVALGKEFK